MSMMLQFATWKKWEDRGSFENIKNPGVYAIAMSSCDLSGKSFEMMKDIVYFGMTNSKGGIRSRLRQLDNSLHKKPGHGGALRMTKDYEKMRNTQRNMFVSVFLVECKVGLSDTNPEEIRKMGCVASLEYECFAQYYENFGEVPLYNDPKRRPEKHNPDEN